MGPESNESAHRTILIEETDRLVRRVVEMSDEYGLTMLGASREGWFRKQVAGYIPERIARLASGRLMLVKHRRSFVKSWMLDTIEFFLDTPRRAVTWTRA